MRHIGFCGRDEIAVGVTGRIHRSIALCPDETLSGNPGPCSYRSVQHPPAVGVTR